MRLCVGILVLVSSLTGCSRPDVVVTAHSPSGKVSAILTESSGGATTSFQYAVSLKAAGSGTDATVLVATAYGAVRNENAYGVNLAWVGKHTIEIRYWKAKRVKLVVPRLQIGGQWINVRLRPGLYDASAPAGGMDYNLTHTPLRASSAQ